MSDSSDSSVSDSSACPSSPRTPAPKFIAFKALSVDKVKSKFDSNAVITSSEFFCSLDPQPASFILEFTFGTQKHPTYFDVGLRPINRTVVVNKMELKIYDEKAHRVGRHADSEKGPIVKDDFTTVCRVKLKDISDVKLVSWNISFSMVYWEFQGSLKAMPPAVPTRLQCNLEELFKTGRDADVTFLVEGAEFTAHKALLAARCPYFDAMFQSKMSEAVMNAIEVTDVRPSVFEEMLHFLYSGQEPKYSDETTLELLSTADKYGVDDLISLCEASVIRNLGPENTIKVLILAERLDVAKLREEASAVFKQYLHILREQPTWDELVVHPGLLLRLLGSFCN